MSCNHRCCLDFRRRTFPAQSERGRHHIEPTHIRWYSRHCCPDFRRHSARRIERLDHRHIGPSGNWKGRHRHRSHCRHRNLLSRLAQIHRRRWLLYSPKGIHLCRHCFRHRTIPPLRRRHYRIQKYC